MSGLKVAQKGGVVPDEDVFATSETSGNFLIGRPARFPFGGINLVGFDGNGRFGVSKRECDV